MDNKIREMALLAYAKTSQEQISDIEYFVNFSKNLIKLVEEEYQIVIKDVLEKDGEATDSWDRGYISGMNASVGYFSEFLELQSNNIQTGADIHSDKGYSESTEEEYLAFKEKRNE